MSAASKPGHNLTANDPSMKSCGPLIGDLISALTNDRFYHALVALLRSTIAFDDIAIIDFYPGKGPKTRYTDFVNPAEEIWDAYLKGIYLLSPSYNYLIRDGAGFRILREIAPDGFFRSEFYRAYMRPALLSDQAGYFVQGVNEARHLISLGRSDKYPKFSKLEARQLAQLEPIVRHAVLYRAAHDQASEAEVKSDVVLKLVEQRIADFGADLLTEREREIVSYLARGYSSKACARELDISPGTERVHRKNIYYKLNVNSQSKLLAKMFDHLLGDGEGQAGSDKEDRETEVSR